ncbi:Centrosomal protein of 97 kDa [Fasciola gigantica]|uniref:Centrosomal protein of 97 kDa n=1 Tax=Fasciola gigantica TaxID=46835 RepID=A0A504Z2G8_FASGI|nr:Centrosomal protein of 97 kDa [Fasciola gigantica]
MYNFLRQGFENIPTVHGPHGEVILNLSKRELDRIEPVPSNVNVLILDHNYIRRLENLGNLYDLQQLSLSGNKLLQMHGVASLTHLTILNLPNNGIVAIDGLLKLNRLRWLNLSGNRIKIMDQLDGNLNLKHLDLSENCIVQLGDISNLRKLTTLLLHANRITSLENAAKYLPHCLEIFSMAGNSLMDIDEVIIVNQLNNSSSPTQRVGIAPLPHSSVTEREVLHSEVIAQQQQHPMPTSPMQLLDSVNTQDTVRSPYLLHSIPLRAITASCLFQRFLS